jgi:hypothetical protein
MEKRYRLPNDSELALLGLLLSREFPGRDEVANQLKNARVRTIDEYGSLEILPSPPTTPASVTQRVAVEAQGADADDVPIHVLLHVVDGRVAELQIHKADGAPIRVMPAAHNFEIA